MTLPGMRSVQRRNGLTGLFRRSNLFLLLVIGWGFGYLLFFGNNSLLFHFLQQSRIRTALADIAALEAENSRLTTEIERIKNDPVHVEMILRKLGYIRPQEKAFRIETVAPAPAAENRKRSHPILLQLAVALPVLLGLAAALWLLKIRSRPRGGISGGSHA